MEETNSVGGCVEITTKPIQWLIGTDKLAEDPQAIQQAQNIQANSGNDMSAESPPDKLPLRSQVKFLAYLLFYLGSGRHIQLSQCHSATPS
jgi:hypothetical protein